MPRLVVDTARRVPGSVERRDDAELAGDPAYPLLFDPQTAGGLLASLDSAAAESCLEQLRALGYVQAQIIGRVAQAAESDRILRLLRS